MSLRTFNHLLSNGTPIVVVFEVQGRTCEYEIAEVMSRVSRESVLTEVTDVDWESIQKVAAKHVQEFFELAQDAAFDEWKDQREVDLWKDKVTG